MTNSSTAKKLLLPLLALIAMIAADQLVKYFTDLYLVPLGSSVVVINGVLSLTSVHNTGAAFSMLENSAWVLIIIRTAASAAIVYFMVRYRDRLHTLLRVCLVIILAGALGNLIDQYAFGYVRDMFEFTFVRFAVFNLADVYITCGAILLIIDMLFFKGRGFLFGKKPEKSPEEKK